MVKFEDVKRRRFGDPPRRWRTKLIKVWESRRFQAPICPFGGRCCHRESFWSELEGRINDEKKIHGPIRIYGYALGRGSNLSRLVFNANESDFHVMPRRLHNGDVNEGDMANGAIEPLAIVGYSLRFPEDATTPDGFWQMLVEGRDCMSDFPRDRLNIDAFYRSDHVVDSIRLRGGHFLKEGLGVFDAPFFSVSPAEAKGLDPQQRILLEITYRALENAGIPIEKCAGSKTSVHVGSFGGDYAALQLRDPLYPSNNAVTGNSHSFLANRLSWFFDFKGPSVTIDTACSSSLSALDLGCKSILNGECSMAVIAGSGLVFDLYHTTILGDIGALSPDSRSFSFDDRANGYGRGEGAATVIVKRVSDAIRDGDPIRAIIRSTLCSQDGRVPIISQPSKAAQSDMIRKAYANAGLDMARTTYFEAHATGTPVGDPIEVSAAVEAFADGRPPQNALYIGSTKPNVGHLEGASGLASVIRTALMLERGLVPPIANLEKLNSNIDVGNLNIIFPRDAVPWPPGLRRASVNSFGMGGSNAHVVMDDAYHFLLEQGINSDRCAIENRQSDPSSGLLTRSTSESQPTMSLTNGHDSREVNKEYDEDVKASPNGHVSGDSHSPNGDAKHKHSKRLLILSGSDRKAIDRVISAYAEHFESGRMTIAEEDTLLDRLAYTLNHRRSQLPWKTFAVVDSLKQLEELSKHISAPVRSKSDLSVGFVFTGQGAQWPSMGIELLCFPSFTDSLLRAQKQLKQEGCTWLLLDELAEGESSSNVDDPAVGQPLCTALQLALVDLLHSFKVRPCRVVGHSSGEIAAAYSVGAISHESAIRVAYHRGRLTSSLAKSSRSPGAMMSVALANSEATEFIEKVSTSTGNNSLVVACINSPDNVTISGEAQAMDDLQTILEKEDVFCRRLNVNVGYHSKQMMSIAHEYRTSIQNLEPGAVHEQEADFYSSLYGHRVAIDTLTKSDYWVQNMTNPVVFSSALSTALTESAQTQSPSAFHLVEIGPTAALRRPVREILRDIGSKLEVTYDSVLRRKESSSLTTIEACGRLFCLGYPVKLEEVAQRDAKSSECFQVLTNLPEYPFDHSKSYWHEGTLSKGYRFRQHARLELLGSPAHDFNPMAPRWRNVIKVSELPWLEEHKVHGEMLYPAAGMLVMAIEASLQVSDQERQIHALSIKDAWFKSPVVIDPEVDCVETQFSLYPVQAQSNHLLSSYDFRLFTLNETGWVENCSGTIQVHFESDADTAGFSRNNVVSTNHLEDYQRATTDPTFQGVDADHMYTIWADNGFHYGNAFQLLHNVSINDTYEALADVNLEKALAPEKSATRMVRTFDPATLDALFQLGMAAGTRAGQEISTTFVPTRIRCLWLRNAKIRDSKFIGAHASVDYSTQDSHFIAVDKETGEQLVTIQGYKTTVVSESKREGNDAARASRLCFKQILKPDISLLRAKEIQHYCTAKEDVVEPVQFSKDKIFMIMATILATLDSTKDKSLDLKPHLQNYVEWMKFQASSFEKDLVPDFDPEWKGMVRDRGALDEAVANVRAAGVTGNVYAEVATKLIDVLKGSIDPLHLLFERGLARDFYSEQMENTQYAQGILHYVGLLTHKNPMMKVLEVGAGTGGLTRHLLSGLRGVSETSGAMFAQYDFTDISRSFFMEAQEEFTVYDQENFRFEIFDVEKDPAGQGFEAGTYDLVLAAAVLHATTDLDRSIQNCRKLLKPNGKLIILELTQPQKIGASFVWGLMEGWWLSAKQDRWNPILDETEWTSVLSKNGFSGIDLAMHDFQDPRCQEASLFVSTAIDVIPEPTSFPNISFLTYTSEQKDLAAGLAEELKRTGYPNSTIYDFNKNLDGTALRETVCISLLEIEDAFLRDMDLNRFESVQKLLSSAKQVLWAACPKDPYDRAKFDMIKGLSRVLRAESRSRALVTLSLQPGQSFEHRLYTMLQSIWSMTKDLASSELECEVVEKNGLLNIPRFFPNKSLNDHISYETGPKQTKLLELGSEPGLRLDIKHPGLLDTFHFVEDFSSSNPLQEDDIEIEAMAFGLNFRDVLLALGRIQGMGAIGCEVSGIVRQAGACAKFNVGDRVTAVAPNGFETLVRCRDNLAARIPSRLSYTEAAAIPVNFVTSYHALCKVARLQKGESVLIHAAAGATGQAAVQIAVHIGAEVYATVGSAEKKKLIMDRYGISEDHIFYSRDTSFAQGVMKKTYGNGVDVVLNSLSGPLLMASWECVAPYGRFIEIGKGDILSNARLPMEQFLRNVSFSAVDLQSLATDRPTIFQKSLAEVMGLVTDGKFHPSQPLQTFQVSELENAFRFMQSGKNTGKVVIQLDRQTLVPMTLPSRPTWNFSDNATYVIAGGLGGVGRSIARWMVTRGARNLLLLSRSGPSTDSAKQMVEELSSQGVTVQTPKCDICKHEEVETAVQESQRTMPPIKGCIQSSTVVEDSVFEKMSHTTWKTSVDPKVNGTFNLHNLLGKGLDFFITLASNSGVFGNESQANYAAGNAYQDALALDRTRGGEKNSVSLDLSLVLDTASASVRDRAAARLVDGAMMVPMTPAEIHALLSRYCDPANGVLPEHECQVVVGVQTPAARHAAGFDTLIFMEQPAWRALWLISKHTPSSDEGSAGGEDVEAVRARFTASESLDDAAGVVTTALAAKLSRALALAEEEIDVAKPMHTYGMDSLVAVEIRNWFAKVFDAELAVFEILSGASFADAGKMATARSSFAKAEWKNGSA